jgi:hypothetical protein
MALRAVPRPRRNLRGTTATLQGVPRSRRNLPSHNSANRPRRRFGASSNGTILENGTASSSSRTGPAMLSSTLLRSRA